MSLQLVMAVVVMLLDSRFFQGAVHALNPGQHRASHCVDTSTRVESTRILRINFFEKHGQAEPLRLLPKCYLAEK